MKHILLTLTLLLAGIATASAAGDDIARADSAYNGDNFQLAVKLYTAAIAKQGPSADLYYNLGNSYYRLKQTGKAVLCYERALRLDPTDSDLRANLEFVNSKLTDRPGERGTFIGNALDSAASCATSNAWARGALILFAITLGEIALYIFTSQIGLRKLGFFGAIVTLLLTVVALFLSFRAASIETADDKAVITEPSTILSTSPRRPLNSSEEAMMLHEGTVVTILDSVTTTGDSIKSTWYNVEIDNARRAWINSADVEKI